MSGQEGADGSVGAELGFRKPRGIVCVPEDVTLNKNSDLQILSVSEELLIQNQVSSVMNDTQ